MSEHDPRIEGEERPVKSEQSDLLGDEQEFRLLFRGNEILSRAHELARRIRARVRQVMGAENQRGASRGGP